MSVNRACTVSFLKSCVVVTLYRSCKALTFAGAAYIYDVACCKDVSLYNILYVKRAAIFKSEFLESSLSRYVSLLEVTCKRLVYILSFYVAIAELYSLVAVVFQSFLLYYDAGACFYYGNGDYFSRLIENLGPFCILISS